MHNFGKLLALIGSLGFFATAFLMPTAVPYGGDQVTNLALQQRQIIAVAGCLVLFLAGVVLAAGGAIVDAIRPITVDDVGDDRLAALGIARQGKDYSVGGFVYGTAAAAIAAAERGKA